MDNVVRDRTRETPKREISHSPAPRTRVFGERQQENREEAFAAAARHHGDVQGALGEAIKRLTLMTPSTAVEFIREQPLGLVEVYLLAEESSQNRDAVLRYFPKVGPAARQRYLPNTAGSEKAPKSSSPARRSRRSTPKEN